MSLYSFFLNLLLNIIFFFLKCVYVCRYYIRQMLNCQLKIISIVVSDESYFGRANYMPVLRGPPPNFNLRVMIYLYAASNNHSSTSQSFSLSLSLCFSYIPPNYSTRYLSPSIKLAAWHFSIIIE